MKRELPQHGITVRIPYPAGKMSCCNGIKGTIRTLLNAERDVHIDANRLVPVIHGDSCTPSEILMMPLLMHAAHAAAEPKIKGQALFRCED